MVIVYESLDRTSIKYWLHHSLDVCDWATYSTSQSLSAQVYNMSRIIAVIEETCAVNLWITIEDLEDIHAFSKLCDPSESLFLDFKGGIAMPYGGGRGLQQFIEILFMKVIGKIRGKANIL